MRFGNRPRPPDVASRSFRRWGEVGRTTTSTRTTFEQAAWLLAPAPDQAYHDSLNDQFLGRD
jgi:hypothetical protein